MTPDTSQVLVAAGLTLFAGLATGIGSAIALFAKRTNFALLAASLSFSAGVMLYVSFTEILGKAERSLGEIFGPRGGGWVTAASFFGGILLIGLIDKLIPSGENPHQVREVETVEHVQEHVHGDDADAPHAADRLLRMGRFAALAIAIHNFPEGMATFMAALQDPNVGLVIAGAVALHNIPEGVSVSVPIFYATGDRRKAFTLSALSGVAEPVGGLLGYAALRAFFTPATMGIVFGVVAGIMVFISLDELLPTAREYGKGHQVVYGLVGGMLVMSLSLLMLR